MTFVLEVVVRGRTVCVVVEDEQRADELAADLMLQGRVVTVRESFEQLPASSDVGVKQPVPARSSRANPQPGPVDVERESTRDSGPRRPDR